MIEKLFMCASCEHVKTGKKETLKCPVCKADMDCIGWLETAQPQKKP